MQVDALFERIEALEIDLNRDVDEKFIRGSGAGGQKINKTSSNVQLIHLRKTCMLLREWAHTHSRASTCNLPRTPRTFSAENHAKRTWSLRSVLLTRAHTRAHTHVHARARTHTPATGIQVNCQRERTREKNRFLALRDLVDKLEVPTLSDCLTPLDGNQLAAPRPSLKRPLTGSAAGRASAHAQAKRKGGATKAEQKLDKLRKQKARRRCLRARLLSAAHFCSEPLATCAPSLL